jgi:hypothetical protein
MNTQDSCDFWWHRIDRLVISRGNSCQGWYSPRQEKGLYHNSNHSGDFVSERLHYSQQALLEYSMIVVTFTPLFTVL